MTITIGGNARAQLQSLIERIENLNENISSLQDDKRDVFKEASSAGYDVPALRAIIKLRKEDASKREEREALIETYLNALGMLADLPLGQAAVERAVA